MAHLKNEIESTEVDTYSERQEIIATMASAIREIFIAAAENRMSESVTQAALHTLAAVGQ